MKVWIQHKSGLLFIKMMIAINLRIIKVFNSNYKKLKI